MAPENISDKARVRNSEQTLATFLVCFFTLAATSSAEDISEKYYVALPAAVGAAITISADNPSKSPRLLEILRYAPNGTVLLNIRREVASRSREEFRVDLASMRPEMDWLKVIEHGSVVVTSAIYELVDGDSVESLRQFPLSRSPGSERDVQSAESYALRHRYTSSLGGDAFFFANLSEYPVRAGMCQANSPNCRSEDLPYTVAPFASIVLAIDKAKRFLVFESSPGFSVANGITYSHGMLERFSASSMISFPLQ